MKKYDIKTTDKETLRKWFYLMTLGRAIDEKAPSYLLQSLGWSYHAPYAGHDGIQLAMGQVFDKDTDFLFPYYRDMLTVLSAGMTAEEIILNGISKATDLTSGGRHMSNHFSKMEWHIENVSSATATHDLHAAGVARAMDRVRKIIADHMVLSKKVSPHVTSVIEVDVTRLVNWRKKVKDQFFKQEGINLTYMPAITEATAKALKAYPLVNSSVDGYNIILKKPINIGIAVSLNDGNLIVPVIHDADKLNLSGLASQIDTLAAKARENKLAPDSIQGGTFTITNFGTFKSLFGTPIINQPQVAILAVGYIEKKPAVVETPEGDTIAIRHKMYLSLSYDHRIVDGALAGAFLRSIADELENWNA